MTFPCIRHSFQVVPDADSPFSSVLFRSVLFLSEIRTKRKRESKEKESRPQFYVLIVPEQGRASRSQKISKRRIPLLSPEPNCISFSFMMKQEEEYFVEKLLESEEEKSRRKRKSQSYAYLLHKDECTWCYHLIPLYQRLSKISHSFFRGDGLALQQ